MSSLTFSVQIETLTLKPHSFHLIATLEEQSIIAKRLNLQSIGRLEAQGEIQKKDHIYVSGTVIADVTQLCVRTLVPLPQHLEVEINEVFTPVPEETQEEIELEAEELTEPLQGNILDLGEVVIQLLSLNIDPYPVAPESGPVEYKENNGASSPFEVLKKKE